MSSGNDTLKSGQWWLDRLQGALPAVVRFVALQRYGNVPDADERVSDALAALVEGSNRFQPQPGKDGIGYFLQYTLSYVAGALRNGAQLAKDWSDEAACFTDVAPDDLGIERLFETLPDDDLVGEAQFVLNNGKVASKTELVDLIADDEARRRIAARILGVQSDDPDLRVRLLQALDAIEDQLRAEPRWIEDVPEPEPVVIHDLEAVTVIRNGVQSEIPGSELRQLVEDASRNAVVWSPEESGVQYETDTPWGSWAAADQARSYRSPFADDNAWPKAVSPLWAGLLDAWLAAGVASDVLDPLMGVETEIPETAQWAVEEMEVLAEVLADEPEGAVRTVARALAYRLAKMGVEVKREDGQLPAEALYEALCWALGVDGTGGWDSELPSAEGLRRAVAEWVGKVAKAKGVWKSQAAAIRALVLERADPRAAKAAARAAFSGA